jgi:hypothetical protein
MSYYANTVLPTLEDVFADCEPPADAVTAATIIDLAGYPDVAGFIRVLSPTNYECAVWDAHLKQIEIDRPQAFASDEQDLGDSYEEGYNNK